MRGSSDCRAACARVAQGALHTAGCLPHTRTPHPLLVPAVLPPPSVFLPAVQQEVCRVAPGGGRQVGPLPPPQRHPGAGQHARGGRGHSGGHHPQVVGSLVAACPSHRHCKPNFFLRVLNRPLHGNALVKVNMAAQNGRVGPGHHLNHRRPARRACCAVPRRHSSAGKADIQSRIGTLRLHTAAAYLCGRWGVEGAALRLVGLQAAAWRGWGACGCVSWGSSVHCTVMQHTRRLRGPPAVSTQVISLPHVARGGLQMA